MFEKHLWKSDFLSQNAGHGLHLYLKCHSSTCVFQTFFSKNQLPGFYIVGTLVENGLTRIPYKLVDITEGNLDTFQRFLWRVWRAYFN